MAHPPAGHVVQLKCWSVSPERTVRVVTRSFSCARVTRALSGSPLPFARFLYCIKKSALRLRKSIRRFRIFKPLRKPYEKGDFCNPPPCNPGFAIVQNLLTHFDNGKTSVAREAPSGIVQFCAIPPCSGIVVGTKVDNSGISSKLKANQKLRKTTRFHESGNGHKNA